MNEALRVATFVLDAEYGDLSAQAVRHVTDAVTDFVGVALAGRRQPLAAVLLGFPMAAGPAYCIGGPSGISADSAALFNGAVGHALDFDDTSHPAYSHPSAHLVPPILALAAGTPLSGREAIVAYAVGHQLEAKLAHSMNLEHYERGWHATGTLGAVSSIATVGRIQRLTAPELAASLAVGASMASGLRVNFGSMTKPLHAGLAARSAVESVHLVRSGLSSAADGIAGRFGFLEVLGGPDAVGRWRSGGDLREPWELDSPIGLALKPYPSCGSTHCAIEAASRMAGWIDGRPIRRIRVGANRLWEQVLVFHAPRSPLEAKFSMEYCVATALLKGGVTLADFSERAVADLAVRDLIGRTVVEVDDRVRDNLEHGAIVAVDLADGSHHEEIVELAAGKPARWPTESELWTKFASCTDGVLARGEAERLFGLLQRLPVVENLQRALMAESPSFVGLG